MKLLLGAFLLMAIAGAQSISLTQIQNCPPLTAGSTVSQLLLATPVTVGATVTWKLSCATFDPNTITITPATTGTSGLPVPAKVGAVVPAGGTGTAAFNFSSLEIPAGAVNGINVLFTLQHSPNPADSLDLYRNGIWQRPGIDYVLNGTNISFQAQGIPQSPVNLAPDTLYARYRYTN